MRTGDWGPVHWRLGSRDKGSESRGWVHTLQDSFQSTGGPVDFRRPPVRSLSP